MIVAATLVSSLLLALSLLATSMRGMPWASRFVYGTSALLCAALAVVGLSFVLLAHGPASLVLPIGLPWLGMHLGIDALSALFMLLLGIGGTAASIYAIGYGAHEHEPHGTLPFYPGFLGAMAFVLLADDAFTFLLSWEIMSLLSWALVLTHHRDDDTRHASYIYLVMAGFGTMVLLLAFGLLAGSAGGYAFSTIRELPRSELVSATVLVLVLIGAGSKAGLMPMHVWLPVAHPAAPSHVSALMSGVMTKIAVYGFVRVSFDLLGPLAWWTSPVVVIAGSATAAMGILFAVNDGDGKRVLA